LYILLKHENSCDVPFAKKCHRFSIKVIKTHCWDKTADNLYIKLRIHKLLQLNWICLLQNLSCNGITLCTIRIDLILILILLIIIILRYNIPILVKYFHKMYKIFDKTKWNIWQLWSQLKCRFLVLSFYHNITLLPIKFPIFFSIEDPTIILMYKIVPKFWGKSHFVVAHSLSI